MVRVFVVMFGAIVAAPGCIMVHSQTPVTEEHISAPHKEPFADLITAPGQRVSMSSTPGPIEGSIQIAPPAPLNLRPTPSTITTEPSTPKPAIDIPPAKQQDTIPVAPSVTPPTTPPAAPPIPAAPVGNDTPPNSNSLYPPSLSANQKPDTPFIAAARAFEDGRSDYGQEQLRALPTANQDLLSKLLPAAAKTATGNLNDPHEVSEIVRKLESAVDQLRSRAEFNIDVLLLASTWKGFGDYKAIPATTSLRPGQLVMLYAEPKWTAPEVISKNGQVHYVICIAANIRVRSGNAVVFEVKDTFRQETLTQLNNICIPRSFSVPTTPGVYTVELELTDVNGRRAKRSLEFRVEDR